MDTRTMVPGVGVGDLRLGATPDEVLARLGRPDETENYAESSMWYYDRASMSLGFEAIGAAWRLTSIDASAPDVRLGTEGVSGATRDRVAAIATRAGLGAGTWSGDPASDSWLEFEEGLRIWFREGRFEEATISLPESQRDEPDAAARGARLPPALVVVRPAPAGDVSTAAETPPRPERRRMSDGVAMVLLGGASLFLALLAVGGINGVAEERRAQREMNGWLTVEGRVTRIDQETSGAGATDTLHRAIVAYAVDGHTYLVREPAASAQPTHQVGARVAVRHPPAAPAAGRIVGDARGRLRASLIVASVCGAGAVMFGFLLWMVRRMR